MEAQVAARFLRAARRVRCLIVRSQQGRLGLAAMLRPTLPSRLYSRFGTHPTACASHIHRYKQLVSPPLE